MKPFCSFSNVYLGNELIFQLEFHNQTNTKILVKQIQLYLINKWRQFW